MQAVVSVLLEGKVVRTGEVRWRIQQYQELVRKISRPKPCTSAQSPCASPASVAKAWNMKSGLQVPDIRRKAGWEWVLY